MTTSCTYGGFIDVDPDVVLTDFEATTSTCDILNATTPMNITNPNQDLFLLVVAFFLGAHFIIWILTQRKN